ncbi:uncharacterized protein [Setaria viridis]|uniref:uncharacterized protein isoform X1 n=1 Tax=Setaria viridis TaxID=4556 RepID=UPI003B3BBF41
MWYGHQLACCPFPSLQLQEAFFLDLCLPLPGCLLWGLLTAHTSHFTAWRLPLLASLPLERSPRGREGSDGGVRGRRGVQVLGGAVAGRAGPHLPQPSAPGGAHRRAAGVQVLGSGGRRPLLLAGDRHRGVEPAAEQTGADRPHGRDARRPQRRLVPPHQRLRASLRPAPLVHRRPRASSSGPGDSTERDQRLHRGDRGAAALQRHLPGHQQLHQDRRPRPGGVRQALQVPGGAPARDAPDRPGGQGVPARRGPRHRPQHAQAPAPGDGVHADPDGGGGGDPGAVPRPQVPGPARVLGRGRQAPAGAPPGAPRPGPARRGLLREHLLGGVLRLLGRRLLHLLVGVHGRRRRLLRRRQRRRGHLGRRPGAREPRGQVLRRRVQRELGRLRLATVAVR